MLLTIATEFWKLFTRVANRNSNNNCADHRVRDIHVSQRYMCNYQRELVIDKSIVIETEISLPLLQNFGKSWVWNAQVNQIELRRSSNNK